MGIWAATSFTWSLFLEIHPRIAPITLAERSNLLITTAFTTFATLRGNHFLCFPQASIRSSWSRSSWYLHWFIIWFNTQPFTGLAFFISRLKNVVEIEGRGRSHILGIDANSNVAQPSRCDLSYFIVKKLPVATIFMLFFSCRRDYSLSLVSVWKMRNFL